jgi:NADPH:quinone reductase-like Zn-dependent oxidoreductase
MSDAPIDYNRYARQIALAEIGADGQRRLAHVPVRFEGVGTLAEQLHTRAGGVCAFDAEHVVVTPQHRNDTEAASLGVAALVCVEAARRVLGEAPAALPDEVLARLGARRAVR